jgi:IS4 transposase
MAPRSTFDVKLLQQLVTEHPEMTYEQYAKILTEDMRAKHGYSYPAVPVATVRTRVSQNRYKWQLEGVTVPLRGAKADLIPWPLAPEYRMHVLVRKLRTLDRLRRGERPQGRHAAREERQARDFEANLRQSKHLVDLDIHGEPVTRPATADELGPDGELLDIVARPRVDA